MHDPSVVENTMCVKPYGIHESNLYGIVVDMERRPHRNVRLSHTSEGWHTLATVLRYSDSVNQKWAPGTYRKKQSL